MLRFASAAAYKLLTVHTTCRTGAWVSFGYAIRCDCSHPAGANASKAPKAPTAGTGLGARVPPKGYRVSAAIPLRRRWSGLECWKRYFHGRCDSPRKSPQPESRMAAKERQLIKSWGDGGAAPGSGDIGAVATVVIAGRKSLLTQREKGADKHFFGGGAGHALWYYSALPAPGPPPVSSPAPAAEEAPRGGADRPRA